MTGIDAHVWPVLVFHGCTVQVREHPADVAVLHSSDLPTWFEGQRHRTLRRAEVATLKTATRASTTRPTPRERPAAPGAADRWSRGEGSALDANDTPTHTVARWRRFGNDRWYVNDSAGDSMGYYDAVKDVVVGERPEDEALVRAALRREDVIP